MSKSHLPVVQICYHRSSTSTYLHHTYKSVGGGKIVKIIKSVGVFLCCYVVLNKVMLEENFLKLNENNSA